MVIRSLTAAAILPTATSAEAHATLEAAIPAVGSRVAAPVQVQLIFDSDIVAGHSTVVIEGPRGFGGLGQLTTTNGYTLAAALKPPVPSGRYHVRWQVTSRVAHHVNEGDFGFVVEPK